jgi:hypothetical protein
LCSSRWIRFHLLPLNLERHWLFKPRQVYKEQSQKMLALIREVIAERCAEPLAEPEIRRLAKLIAREIRRGRHPGVRVRKLLQDEQKAKDFLFTAIKKKNPDLKLKLEFASLDVQQSARGPLSSVPPWSVMPGHAH